MRVSVFPANIFIVWTHSWAEKVELPLRLKGIFPSFVPIEYTKFCTPRANSGVQHAAVSKSPCRAWRYIDIVEILSFRHKEVVAR
jgi:hypothetical protein